MSSEMSSGLNGNKQLVELKKEKTSFAIKLMMWRMKTKD